MKSDLLDDLSAQEDLRELCCLMMHGWDFDTALNMSKAEKAEALEAIAQVLLIRIKQTLKG